MVTHRADDTLGTCAAGDSCVEVDRTVRWPKVKRAVWLPISENGTLVGHPTDLGWFHLNCDAPSGHETPGSPPQAP